jgi:NADH-quinone oxidoreductase subunit L
MLMLVMANNFLQLFFGWEAVGLVSYLLIGFWYTRPTAIFANMKAFLVNRVGDFGFLLGIAGIVLVTGSLHYAGRFAQADTIAADLRADPGRRTWSARHGDLHLPVHRRDGQVGAGAAARLAAGLDGRPDADLGADPCGDDGHRRHLHGGAHVAAVRAVGDALSVRARDRRDDGAVHGPPRHRRNDIKRVVAYSTLSQLGYMTVALGASAYAAAIFHLMTHAFFKALLFLAAGSVIIAMHHEQDMRKMGGLRKYMPITYWTCADRHAGADRLPGLFGLLLEGRADRGRRLSTIPGAGYAYWCVLIGVFVTAFYSSGCCS